MTKRKFLFFVFNFLLLFLINLFKFRKVYPSENITKVLFHRNVLNYIISENHPEKPARIKQIINKIKESNLKENFTEIDLTKLNHDVYKWIKEVHTIYHINSLKKKNANGELASRTATMICLHGADLVISKKAKNIFCLVRPPGHHALNSGKIEGFCFYNHVAITAKYLQKKFELKKILIVDWDYHHGNSTENIFYDDPNVLFFSSHDQFAYPGTGSPNREGKGLGKGFNINIHLPCGIKDSDIIKTYESELIMKALEFKPDFILVSAGFDSRKNDPLGCFDLSDRAFEELTKIVMKIANKTCDGRILSILEGGYNIQGNSKAVIKHINILKNFI